jgi:hypothetical protein
MFDARFHLGLGDPIDAARMVDRPVHIARHAVAVRIQHHQHRIVVLRQRAGAHLLPFGLRRAGLAALPIIEVGGVAVWRRPDLRRRRLQSFDPHALPVPVLIL